MSSEFFLTSLIVVLLPGTGVIYTLAVGLGRGFTASLAAALGCTMGIIPAALASSLGLSALLHTSALAFQLLKFAGLLYLLYMAYQIIRENGVLGVSETQPTQQTSLLLVAVRGALINVLNPKLSLFFLAFLPQFIDERAGQINSQLIILALWFMVLTLLVFIVYGAFAALARVHVLERPGVMRWARYAFGGSLAVLGVRLALSSNRE